MLKALLHCFKDYCYFLNRKNKLFAIFKVCRVHVFWNICFLHFQSTRIKSLHNSLLDSLLTFWPKSAITIVKAQGVGYWNRSTGCSIGLAEVQNFNQIWLRVGQSHIYCFPWLLLFNCISFRWLMSTLHETKHTSHVLASIEYIHVHVTLLYFIMKVQHWKLLLILLLHNFLQCIYLFIYLFVCLFVVYLLIFADL